jgi:hypothetical protein
MNDRAFIAELHDIGKLVDKDALKSQNIQISDHIFHKFDFSQIEITPPASPSWWGQYHHGEEVNLSKISEIPQDYIPDVILLKIADRLAASISRPDQRLSGLFQSVKKDDGLHILWNPGYYKQKIEAGKKWAAFENPDKLREMFQFIDTCSSPKEFLDRFKENLQLTAENKSSPFNIIDLFTHVELTGKIYRILKKHSQYDKQGKKLIYCNEEIQDSREATGGMINRPDQKKGKWIYRLIFCKVEFSNGLIRMQDLNILRKRIEIIKAFEENENSRDYVLFRTDDFLCLFVPKEEVLPLQTLLKPFLDFGFILDYMELVAELELLTSTYSYQYKTFHQKQIKRDLKLYEKRLVPDILKEITPPLCDSCQMKQGSERVKDQIHEYLCDDCNNIRKMGDPAQEYSQWDDENIKAAWLKISLDEKQLEETLYTLFEKYVSSCSVSQPVQTDMKEKLKEIFRPLAVHTKFVHDYQSFLNDFSLQIYEIKQRDQSPQYTHNSFLFPIKGYNEFGIFKVKSGEEILPVLDLFYDLLETHFPECLDSSPIKFSMSIARTKYPYRNHWEFLSKPKNDINIQIAGSSRLLLTVQQYQSLRKKLQEDEQRTSHWLHRLSDIEQKTQSKMVVQLEIMKDPSHYSFITDLMQRGLSIRQILDFHKLINEVRGT